MHEAQYISKRWVKAAGMPARVSSLGSQRFNKRDENVRLLIPASPRAAGDSLHQRHQWFRTPEAEPVHPLLFPL